ncbi:MAG: hypothetical protein QOJ48_707 [Frankiales bacterium]|nr:hypothetical protein [Frankiales bacterium]
MTLTSDTRTTSLTALRDDIAGQVFIQGEDGYAELVASWNLAVAMAPRAVVAAQTADDVAAAVRFAGRHGLQVGVQATGHGAVASLAGDILISTKLLDEVTVHAEGWARVGGGAKWAQVLEPAHKMGFAGLNGSTSDVGVVGYLTGGGVGPMARTYGVSSGTVRAFDVVTGDGELRHVTADEHPDLFFGLRGGKGSLGIVTAVEFDLVPLTHFYGGALFFEGVHAADVAALWSRWSLDLPESITTSFAVLQLPPLPGIPEPLAGKTTITVRYLATGDPIEAEDLLAPMRAIAPTIIDSIGLHPYPAVDLVHVDPVDPMPVVEQTVLLSEFPYAALEALMVRTMSGSPQVITEVRQLGGAYAQAPEVPDAFDHRAAAYSVFMAGIPDIPGTMEHGRDVIAALQPWAHQGMWPNFRSARDAESTAAAYTPATLARLRAAARAYDPAGVLTMGAAICS